jgi:uncharacterized protein (DUF433 family)
MLVPVDIYKGEDPRNIPMYGFSEVSRYLDIPVSTLRAWTLGQDYPSQDERNRFEPVIERPDPDSKLLSFINVCEAHICDALRKSHGIPLQRIRAAIALVGKLYPNTQHPLVEHRFATSGLELFIEEFSNLINLTRRGQVAMRECLSSYLKRVEFDEHGVASKLFPFTWENSPADAPKVIVLDPRTLFGRPVIVNTRIATSVVYGRWKAGESVESLARDYGRTMMEVEEALRCEQHRKAA